MTDLTPPEGFNLTAEESRQEDAAIAGIVARDNPPETDEDGPVNGVPGEAEADDDDAIEDAGETVAEPLEEI